MIRDRISIQWDGENFTALSFVRVESNSNWVKQTKGRSVIFELTFLFHITRPQNPVGNKHSILQV